MPWSTSTRKSELPADWTARREQVRRRAGGRCEMRWHGKRCKRTGTECHHLDRDNHDVSALMWLCSTCHEIETRKQSIAAQRALNAKMHRRKRPNPGLLA